MTFESEKYIVFADNGNRILTRKGFRKINKINGCTIRLFNTATECKYFIENHVTYYRLDVEIRKVNVTYEVV